MLVGDSLTYEKRLKKYREKFLDDLGAVAVYCCTHFLKAVRPSIKLLDEVK